MEARREELGGEERDVLLAVEPWKSRASQRPSWWKNQCRRVFIFDSNSRTEGRDERERKWRTRLAPPRPSFGVPDMLLTASLTPIWVPSCRG